MTHPANPRRTWNWLWAVAVSLATTVVRSDSPPRSMSELTPPTEEEWHRLDLVKRRAYGCDHCCAKPLLVYREVYYFPCEMPVRCGEPSHRSFRGAYGIRHPMPYYIKEPKFEALAPWQSCRVPLRQTLPSQHQPHD